MRSLATLCSISSSGVVVERKARTEKIVILLEAGLGTNTELRA